MSISAALLQGGIGGAFLIILLLVLLAGGLLVAAVFGGSLASTPEGGGRRRVRSLFPARALCVLGVGSAVIGLFFISVATDIIGMLFGMGGYFLGARVLGALVIILSTATLIVGLLVAPAAVPGGYDQSTSGESLPSSGKR